MAGEVALRSGLGEANCSRVMVVESATTLGLKATRRFGVGLRLRLAAATVVVSDNGESMAELIVGCW